MFPQKSPIFLQKSLIFPYGAIFRRPGALYKFIHVTNLNSESYTLKPKTVDLNHTFIHVTNLNPEACTLEFKLPTLHPMKSPELSVTNT